MKKTVKAGIVGGSGFTGLELVKVLSFHSYVKISFVTSRTYKNLAVSDVFPSYTNSGNAGLSFIEEAKNYDLEDIDIIFLCLPPNKSMEYLKGLKNNYTFKIIDIGSDFRLKMPEDYKYWYGTEHIMKEKLSSFVYGLPEINKDKIQKSNYVANPGCYPTSVLLGLAPIIKGEEITIKDICIDSKSGVSGAGRKPEEQYLFTNIENNFYAYSAAGHRHTGEIEQGIEEISGKKFKINFTPHLLPVNRGIFTSIYCRISTAEGESNTDEKIYGLYEKFCNGLPFIKFTGTEIPQLRDVIGTNMCLLGYKLDERTGTLKIFSAIDNLLKGAAGQAVQNMNIMMDFDEKEGLCLNGIFS